MEEKKITQRVECAWCRDVIEEGDPGAKTTHTMCAYCIVRQEHEFRPIPRRKRAEIRAYLQYLDMVEDDPSTNFGDDT